MEKTRFSNGSIEMATAAIDEANSQFSLVVFGQLEAYRAGQSAIRLAGQQAGLDVSGRKGIVNAVQVLEDQFAREILTASVSYLCHLRAVFPVLAEMLQKCVMQYWQHAGYARGQYLEELEGWAREPVDTGWSKAGLRYRRRLSLYSHRFRRREVELRKRAVGHQVPNFAFAHRAAVGLEESSTPTGSSERTPALAMPVDGQDEAA